MCEPTDREALKALATQREALEAELSVILERLNAPGQPGVRGNLVDAEARRRVQRTRRLRASDAHWRDTGLPAR